MRQLPVNYYPQPPTSTDDSYCGPASAQMVLESIKAGLIPQEHLFERAKEYKSSDTSPWHTTPDGLCAALEAHKPENLTFTFTLFDLDTPEAMARKVCWSIAKHNLPPIVLLDGCHWVVVTGFEPTFMPSDVNDTSHQISKFLVHNPQPGSNPMITYDDWISMPAVLAGQWKGKYIVICDGDELGKLQPSARKPRGERVDNLKKIMARASQEVEASMPALPRSRGGARMAPQETIGDPVLVERLDYDPPVYYYIVPIRSQKGKVTRLVNVNGHEHGGVNGSLDSSGVIAQFMAAKDPQAVIDQFAGREFEVGGTNVTPQAEDLHERLVWRPCRESLSPYVPFYRFDVVGPQGESSFYVRIDGEFFPELRVEMGM